MQGRTQKFVKGGARIMPTMFPKILMDNGKKKFVCLSIYITGKKCKYYKKNINKNKKCKKIPYFSI